MSDVTDYLADHYGRCVLDICGCLRMKISMWPGRACKNWVTVPEMTFEARLAALKAGRKP